MTDHMSDAGKLYLHEYRILEGARDGVHTFLAQVAKEVRKRLDAVAPPSGFRRVCGASNWWTCYSSLVAIDESSPPARAGKEDIYLGYFDCRSQGWDLAEATLVQLYIESPKGVRLNWHNDEERLSRALRAAEAAGYPFDFERGWLSGGELKLNLSSATQAADELAQELIARQSAMDAFMVALSSE